MNKISTIKTSPLVAAKNVFIRYNLIICIVLVGGALMYTTLAITNILAQPVDTNSSNNVSFDQTTINKLNNYGTSVDNTNYNILPQGRINPFFE